MSKAEDKELLKDLEWLDMEADNPVDACYKTIIELSELKIKKLWNLNII